MTLRSPTATCRAIDEMRLPWPYTRSIWRRNPIFRRLATPAQAERGEVGTVNHCALDVLEDIIGWYRITRTRDEATGDVISETRLFDHHALQKDYATWAEDLGYSKRQVQDAVALLNDAGLVRRWCAVQISGYGVKVGNAVFVEPCPEVVRAISRPVIAPQGGDPPLSYKRERSPAQTREGARMDERGVTPACATLKTPKSARKTQANQQQQPPPARPVDPPEDAASDVVVAGNLGEKTEKYPDAEGQSSAEKDDAQPCPEETLFRGLVNEGMGEAQARRAAYHHSDMAERQLMSLLHALPGEVLKPADRGAWLNVAIRDGYGPTKGYQKHLDARKAEAEQGAALAQHEATRRARTEAERVAFDALADDLTMEEKAVLRQKARNCVHPEMRAMGEAKCARLIQTNYDGLLRGERMKEHCLWGVPGAAAPAPSGPKACCAEEGGDHFRGSSAGVPTSASRRAGCVGGTLPGPPVELGVFQT